MDWVKTGKIFLKWLVIIASVFYIVYRVNQNSHAFDYASHLDFSFHEFGLIVMALFLVVVNWMLESIKWKLLIDQFENISLKKSYRGVLVGLAVAIFTPNRIGEYIGRPIILEKHNRSKGVVATVAGSLSQVLVTLIIGISSVILMLGTFPEIKTLFVIQPWLLIGTAFILCVFLIWCYLNLVRIGNTLSRLSFLKSLKESILSVSKYSKTVLLKVFLLSFLRYMVFTTQFMILLWVFKVDIFWLDALIAIGAGYFVILFIPAITFAEAGLRGAVSLFFMEMVSESTMGILASAVFLWIINLALPALIGAFFLSKVKVK